VTDVIWVNNLWGFVLGEGHGKSEFKSDRYFLNPAADAVRKFITRQCIRLLILIVK
jgi:hypothetical protein